MALPMASYVYWKDDASGINLMCINIATLAGTLLGQVAFGYLADRYGRKKMYGVELTLLITSTLGVVMSSTGVNNSMDVFAWLVWWRIVVGIGVGADYPLSAVITSEYVLFLHGLLFMANDLFSQLQIRSYQAPCAHDGGRILHATSGSNRRKPRLHDRDRRQQKP